MSVYEAIFEAVAEAEGVEPDVVRDALQHREHVDDYFWNAWDMTVASSRELFQQVMAALDGIDAAIDAIPDLPPGPK